MNAPLSLVALLLAVAACTRAEERVLVPAANASPAALTSDAAIAAPPSQAAMVGQLSHALRAIETGDGRGTMHLFRIPLAHAAFDFVDLQYRTPLVEARAGRDLIFNGGYWAYRGKERVIEGLVLVNGNEHAPKNGNLSGGVLEVREGKARMVRSGDFVAQASTSLAVQCSPRLVVDGAPVPKLESSRRAARTALCVGADRSSLLVYLTDDGTRPTLPELAHFLVGEGCVEALNLDGGPSTAASLKRSQGELRIGVGEALPYGFGVRILSR